MTERIEVGALNIVASPHPKGIYVKILKQVANKEVVLWGSDQAKITPIDEIEDRPGLWLGRVLLWAEIDTEGDWINKEKNVRATPEEKRQIAEAIPEEFEPNFRSFWFVLIEDKHRIVIEYMNELGQHLAPSRAERLFLRLFRKHLPPDAPEVDVTVVPEAEALEKIFAIPRLRTLEIYIKRPNAGDDAGEEAARVLKKLERQGARAQTQILEKAAKKKTLEPDNETRALAEVGVENGYVSGRGKDGTGKPVFESTQKHPKVISMDISGPTSFATFLSTLTRFGAVAKPNKDS
jgi:hypothetical protein